jgi:hypothetical protein
MVLVRPESGVGFNGVAPVVPDTNTIPPSSNSGRAQSLRRDLPSKGHAPYDRRSTNANLLNFPRHARQFQLVLLFTETCQFLFTFFHSVVQPVDVGLKPCHGLHTRSKRS